MALKEISKMTLQVAGSIGVSALFSFLNYASVLYFAIDLTFWLVSGLNWSMFVSYFFNDFPRDFCELVFE